MSKEVEQLLLRGPLRSSAYLAAGPVPANGEEGRLVRGRPPKPASGDVSARRHALRDEAGRLAADLGWAVVEAETVNVPVEPGVREARDALTGVRPGSAR